MSARGPQGRFVTGSTMRHVAVMTMAGSLGLTFMFLVDFVTLFYVSLLGDERLTSAVGYAWTIQFFTVSVGIGFAIAATATVSRALGARRREDARRLATSSLSIAVAGMALTAGAALAFRRELLALLGAEGMAAQAAADFLSVTLPSLPLMAAGMAGGSILRAQGDARRSMMVTLGAGLAAMVLDPLFIFGFDMGVQGAAWAMALSRAVTTVLALRFLARVHDLLAPFDLRAALGDLRPVLAVALPASLTQLSTPFGNFLFTGAIAQFGDSAVAGWSVVSRMTVLAFGGIFALSGAIGGIIGQNYGAGRLDRVRSTLRDALIFNAGYVAAVWAVLALSAPHLAAAFSLSEDGARVVAAFGRIAAGGFLFAGALFVANSAFNNLGRPMWSALFNWSRDAIAAPVMLALFVGPFMAPGVVYAQAAAGVLAGIAAAAAAWRLVGRLEAGARPAAGWGAAPPTPSGRAGASMPVAEAAGVHPSAGDEPDGVGGADGADGADGGAPRR
ncbi:MATE family efflux transporter [Oceanicella actignis]|uniref:Putative efflux protein, MATE family n=1 Tax=Oceanicella actignis TaxID=1189325 RepID=A0A1M7SUV9_9RHOB|nr:MATE family efflux transporter [Oceanicella actignis]SES71507.1 putative efflux protein, MATE family [Oceanicella actignis]SHN62190.1 putative efflux protein, MATE family [Oceanicella actignis]